MDREENLFDFKEDLKSDGKLLIKVAKRKSTVRIMCISFGIMLCIIVLGMVLAMQINPLTLKRATIDRSIYENIYGGNTYISQWDKTNRLINPEAKAAKYKIVDGIVVAIGEVTEPSVNSNPLQKIEGQQGDVFGVYGERMMRFYHPKVAYDTYPNELNKLEAIDDQKKVEVAISLDKAYTYEDIKMMLPHNITLQWSWVDIYDEPNNQNIFIENELVGIRSFNSWGKALENPVEAMFSSLEAGIRNRGESKEVFATLYNRLEEEVEIIGIVVSGTPKALLELQQEDYVKASTIGVVADCY